MPEMKLRPIKAADSHWACVLIKELGHDNDEKSLAWRISAIDGTPRERVMVAEVDGKPAGLCAANVYRYFHTEGLVCRVTVLLVDKAYRKHGIGHTLMAWAESWSREQGCDRMEISARKESSDSLQFLLKLGYEDTSRRFFKHLSGDGQKGEV